MGFEGPEKKFELLLVPGAKPLRGYGLGFWERVVGLARASIISITSNEDCDAYLLSESSLFVFDERVVMITCGCTTLVDSILELLETIPLGDIQSLIYERKNENFPNLQPATFSEDVEKLRAVIPGETLVFGEPDGYSISLFCLTKKFQPEPNDKTLQLLMHDIEPQLQRAFYKISPDAITEIRARVWLESLLPGFQVDDFVFTPQGYSLNAIKGGTYYTFHVTPQKDSSYVSFETNYCYEEAEAQRIIGRVLDIFRPQHFDILSYQESIDCGVDSSRYRMQHEAASVLECGYQISYAHFQTVEDSKDLAMQGVS